MSSTMYWKPRDDIRQDRIIPTNLKIILQNLDSLDEGSLDYLRGLADAGVEGADELIAAVRKHDIITLFEVW